MKLSIIGLISLGFIACKKDNHSGNLGSCKSVYETNDTNIIINDTLLSPFCLLTDKTYQLDVSSFNLSNISWNTGDSTTSLSISETGVYSGYGIDSSNDTIHFSFNVLNCNSTIYTPNAFSPNADGQNDLWRIYTTTNTICNEDFQLSIFDAHHQLVYNTYSSNIYWDGTYKGLPAPQGVYHYIIKYKREDGETFDKKGQLLLIR